MKRLLVIGGGLAGLSAAWHARRAGVEVRLLESASHPGGVVQSFRDEGFLLESGPNTILLSNPALTKLLRDLGLEKEIVETVPAARQRFLVRGGRLLPVPLSPGRLLTTPLLGLSGKLRLLREPFAPARSDDAAGDESLADFARRRLGSEALAFGLEPFAAGIFAGDAEKLSVRHAFPRLAAAEREHGSLVRAALRARRQRRDGPPRLISFNDGLAALPRALSAPIGESITLRAQLRTLTRTADGSWEASWQTPEATATERFDGVVLAVPAHSLSGLPLPPDLSAQLAPLNKIEHPPVTVALLGYPRHAIAHPLDGFGVLVPSIEPFQILGALFNSSLFPGRAPAGHVLLTVFVGGARHPELARLDDDALWPILIANIEKLLAVNGAPAYRRLIRWPLAIPQYNLGHGEMLVALDAAEAAWPGLALAGSYRGGVSVTQTLESGRVAARRALKLSPTAGE